MSSQTAIELAPIGATRLLARPLSPLSASIVVCHAEVLKRTLSEGARMPSLCIDLREGFLDDIVVVRINNEEYHKPQVSTRLQLGYADSLEIDVRESTVDVEIVLPSRGLSKSIPIVFDRSDTVYLGLSVTAEGEISERISHEPFGYL
jgi:hypothetical protein